MINRESCWIIEYEHNRDAFLIMEGGSDVTIIVTMLDLMNNPYHPFIKVIDEYRKIEANIRRGLNIVSPANNFKLLGKG